MGEGKEGKNTEEKIHYVLYLHTVMNASCDLKHVLIKNSKIKDLGYWSV